jgi:hypothetical protein
MKNISIRTIARISAVTFLIFALSATPALALKMGFSDVGSGDALPYFVDVTAAGENHVSFLFTNESTERHGISQVFYDDDNGLLAMDSIVIQESEGVSFAVISSDTLPQGETINFEPELVLKKQGSQANAVGSGEYLETIFSVNDGGFLDVVSALQAGDLRMAVKGSPVGVNSVPEPSTLLLFGTSLFGLAALRRKH